MEQFDRIKQARDARLHKEDEDVRHNELITQSIQTQETILRAFSSLVDYLDTRVGRTEVVNQLKQIGTPDALKVVDAISSLHETLKTHENTDLTEVTAIMQAVLDEAKLIPKELPQLKDIVIPEAQDYSTQFEAMIGAVESLEEAVKAQETTVQAPVVNVDAPIVKVDAPDLKPLEKASQKLLDAIKSIVIPAQIQTDIQPLLKEQKKTNKLLEELPLGGGGGGSLAGVIPTKEEDTAHTSGDLGMPILGVRSDDDVATASDGDYTVLKLDEQGRLKVSSKPASYPDITGDITAVQAVISTPVVGGTVSGDVSRASNVMAFCTGTFSTINCTFEGSIQDSGDTNWFGIQAIRTNANTIETATGNLSAQPAYGWELSVNALKRVRVRATARTSGTQSWRFVQGTYATEPIPGAQVSATQPISGTVTITNPNGTIYSLVTTVSTNGALIKNAAGTLYEITISNPTATAAYVKLYNKSSAPTVGTDVPLVTISVPATSSTTMPVALMWGSIGKRFGTGIGISVTAGPLFSDTANAVAGIQVSATYI